MSPAPALMVCGEAEGSARLARTLQACRMRIRGNRLQVTKEDAERVLVDVALPARRLVLRDAVGSSLEDWREIIAALSAALGGTPHIVVDFDHPLREVVLLASRWGRITYSLHVANPPERLSSLDYGMISAAKNVLFSDTAAEERFRKAFVGAYRTAEPSPASLLSFLDSLSATAPVPQADASKLRVLFVCYFAGRCNAVGAKRVNYWFDEIANLTGGEVIAELASAMAFEDPPGVHHHVPDHEIAEAFFESGPVEWASEFARTEAVLRQSFNTLSYFWRIALERHFEALDTHFGAVVLSGNPFAVFDFANYARRKWGARVILDYRDPFALNPRIAYKPNAREVAAYTERGYNHQADLITTVNDECVKLVAGPVDAGIQVVTNGYDERQLDQIASRRSPEARPITFVHAGSIFHDRSPRALIGALDPALHRFVHVGSLAGIEPNDLEHPAVVAHGPMPYDQALRKIADGHIGVVFVSETGFETPTKLYDYIGLGLELLICTHGPLREGPIARLLEGREGVHWCKNTSEALISFVQGYVPGRGIPDQMRQTFSRRHGLERLVTHIQDLCPRFSPNSAVLAPACPRVIKSSRPTDPIFIVGSGRCGTTILDRSLGRHPSLTSFPFEPQIIARSDGKEGLSRFIHEDEYDPSGYLWRRFHFRTRYGEAMGFCEWVTESDYAAFIRRLTSNEDRYTGVRQFIDSLYNSYLASQGADRWIDGSPVNGMFMREISGVYPTSRFVHIVRDGRDVAKSFARLGWAGGAYEPAVLFWRDRVNAIRKAARAIDGLSYTEIRLEELIRHPEASIARLSSFLQIDATPEMSKLISYERSQRDTSSHTPEQTAIIRAAAPDLFEEFRAS